MNNVPISQQYVPETYNLQLNIENVLENIQRQANGGNIVQQQQLQVSMVYFNEESLEVLLEEGKMRAMRASQMETQWAQQMQLFTRPMVQ